MLSIILAFVFGYVLTLRPLLRRMRLADAARIAFAADTASITVMEVVDNAVMVVIPGAMDASLVSMLFWPRETATKVYPPTAEGGRHETVDNSYSRDGGDEWD